MSNIIKKSQIATKWYKVRGQLYPEDSRYGLCYVFKTSDNIKVYIPTSVVSFKDGYTYIGKVYLDCKLSEKNISASDIFGYQYETVHKLP